MNNNSSKKIRLISGLLLIAAFLIGTVVTPVLAAVRASDYWIFPQQSIYLAFTSDVHNDNINSDSASAKRLEKWINNTSKTIDSRFDNIGICGDIASSLLYDDDFWDCAQETMDVVTNNENIRAKGIFTTGNHEWKNGDFANSNHPVTANYLVTGEAANTNRYQIYCFGATSTSDVKKGFKSADIAQLKDYLESSSTNKPIFILSHFPIHSYGERSTKNADLLLNVLNEASINHNIIFLWGHNHTLSDVCYDRIITDKLGEKEILFTYAAAGCMSDKDYSKGSGSVSGKGLVVEIKNSEVTFTYYTEKGTVVPFRSGELDLRVKNKITASDITKTYSKNSQSVKIKAEALGGAQLKYKSDNSNIKVDSKTGKITIKKKYAGQATITITAKKTDCYKETTKKITVTVKPSKSSITSAKFDKAKNLIAKYKKVDAATGYQIQCSSDKNFKKSVKSVTTKKNTTLSATFKELTKGNKYYLRVRAYKTVSGKKIYSGWSASFITK